MTYVKCFQPIESDPGILTELMHRLGVQDTFWFEDVLDYEQESQDPALALIAIFPESSNDERIKEKVEAERQPITTENVKFLRQTIDNSCGLIAVLHCILNTAAVASISRCSVCGVVKWTDSFVLEENSILYNAIQSEKGVTAFLEGSEELETEYQSVVDLGDTEIPSDIKYHYIALVDGSDHKLYELDGERSSPLVKGVSSKVGYILNDSELMKKTIQSLTHGGIDFSLFKLKQAAD